MGILIDWLIYVLLIWGLVKGLNATAFKREPASRTIAWTLTICMFFVNLIALTLVQAIQYKMLSQGIGVDIKPKNAVNITGAFTATWIFFVLLRKSPKNTKANSQASTISSLIARFTTTDTSTTDATYEKIDQELKTDNLDRATWTRAQGDAEGNAERAKALYIKYRAQRLLAAVRNKSAHPSTVDAVGVEKRSKKYNPHFVAATAGVLVCAVVAAVAIGFFTEKSASTKAATGGGNAFDQFDTEKPAQGAGKTPSKSVDWSQSTPVQTPENIDMCESAPDSRGFIDLTYPQVQVDPLAMTHYGLSRDEYCKRMTQVNLLCRVRGLIDVACFEGVLKNKSSQ